MDQQALLEDIRSLMQGPLDSDPVEARARVERTLTDGYAHALALEGERLQIERRIDEVTSQLDTDEGGSLVGELSALSQKLGRTERALAELRGLLASLRDRLRR
jgi:hypothetical protein